MPLLGLPVVYYFKEVKVPTVTTVMMIVTAVMKMLGDSMVSMNFILHHHFVKCV
jgi:hypothetical protein